MTAKASQELPAALETRIAKALSDSDLDSNALGALIEETSTAVEAAEKEAKAAQEAALDIVTSPDPVKARVATENARFTAERLRNILPRMQVRFDDVVKQEAEAAWIAEHDRFKPERDAFDEELRTVYTEFVDRLVPLLHQLAQVNVKVSRINAMRPSRPYDYYGDQRGAGRWLNGVKLKLQQLALPNPDKPTELLWPPPVNYFTPDLVPHIANPGANWHETLQAENARRKAEDEKAADEQAREEAHIRNDPRLWKSG